MLDVKPRRVADGTSCKGIARAKSINFLFPWASSRKRVGLFGAYDVALQVDCLSWDLKCDCLSVAMPVHHCCAPPGCQAVDVCFPNFALYLT